MADYKLVVLLLACVVVASLGSAQDSTAEAAKQTTRPTTRPTTKPTTRPTTRPTTKPTTRPTTKPTTKPTTRPTTRHTTRPTTKPTTRPTTRHTTRPTTNPTTKPTTIYHSTRTTPRHLLSRYYYMDDPMRCLSPYTSSNINYLLSASEDAYLQAYDKSYPTKRISRGCAMTFSSYAKYGLKLKFNPAVSNYINDCRVTLRVFKDSNVEGNSVASYSCFDTLPTQHYIYIDSKYVTIQLYVPVASYTTNYDFSLHIENWDDRFNGGDIAGVILGSFAFLAIVIGISLCVRRRRMRRRELHSQTLITNQVPPATSNYPTGYAPNPPSYGTVSYPPPK